MALFERGDELQRLLSVRVCYRLLAKVFDNHDLRRIW
jgi:hypothetical protein